MDPIQPSNVSGRNGDGIIEMKQGDPGEQTTKLQSNENDYESDFISDLLRRNRDEIIVHEEVNKMSEENLDHVQYRSLYKAVQENDWASLDEFVTKNPEALTAKIKIHQEETLFHILIENLDTPNSLMEKFASMVPPESLELLTNSSGWSVLFIAAYWGNKKAAEIFVGRNPNLPNIIQSGILPIHLAAVWGHKEMIQYLLTVTTIPLDDVRGVTLLRDLIRSGQYGTALDLLKKYPKLAREPMDRGSILEVLANKPLAFESGSRFGYWQRLIYRWTPVQEKCPPRPENVHADVENTMERTKKSKNFTYLGSIRGQISTAFGALSQKLHFMLWNALMQLAPTIKCIHDRKLTHIQLLEIVTIMCHEGVIWRYDEAFVSLRIPVVTAAKLGIYELVQEIRNAYLYAITFSDYSNFNLLSMAVLHRQEKVFSSLCRMYKWKYLKANLGAICDNTLHLAGSLVPPIHVPGAALQMQRELQWFKAVESVVHPSFQEQRNYSNKTPREVFTENHKDLVKEGEKWMKDTAQSCTVVAALIITVVFAAAFTVPGGINGGGVPNFLREPSFLVFIISDALALISSTTSLLMFLGILTARYSEEDFLVSLPKKLIVGLIAIFFSIASMMVAFGATIFIVLYDPWEWVIIPTACLGCLPVTLFAWMQFPLLVEIYLSTYRSSIFQPTN